MLSLIFQDPFIFFGFIFAILFVLTIHEFSHAYSAYLAGDQTAKEQGRLTFNPLAHVDILGLIMLFVAGFGWGKPVPINPANFKNPRRSVFFVSLAGPFSNFFAGVFFIIVLKILTTYLNLASGNLLVTFLFILIVINFSLFIFNLLPIPPLDGSKVLFSLLPDRFINFKYSFSQYGPWLLIGLILIDNFLNLGLFSYLFSHFFSLISRIVD